MALGSDVVEIVTPAPTMIVPKIVRLFENSGTDSLPTAFDTPDGYPAVLASTTNPMHSVLQFSLDARRRHTVSTTLQHLYLVVDRAAVLRLFGSTFEIHRDSHRMDRILRMTL